MNSSFLCSENSLWLWKNIVSDINVLDVAVTPIKRISSFKFLLRVSQGRLCVGFLKCAAAFTQKSKQRSSGKEFLDGSCVSSLKQGKWIYSLYRSGCWLLPNLVFCWPSRPSLPMKIWPRVARRKKGLRGEMNELRQVALWEAFLRWMEARVRCGSFLWSSWLNPPLSSRVCGELTERRHIYGDHHLRVDAEKTANRWYNGLRAWRRSLSVTYRSTELKLW